MNKMHINCFECGSKAECNHHVVPVSLGGTKTIPLCLKCHGLVHDVNFIKHKRLQKIGIKKAKEAGLYQGRKSGTFKKNFEEMKEILNLKEQLHTVQEISDRLGISKRTIYRYMKLIESK